MIKPLFYRLPALAERWGCTQDDLLQDGIGGQVQICYPIAMLTFRSKSSRETAALPVEQAARIAQVTDTIPAPGYFRLPTGALQLIENGEPAEVSMVTYKVSTGEVWRTYYRPPILVRRDDLCVLRVEVERLEREGFVRAPACAGAPVPVPAAAATTTVAAPPESGAPTTVTDNARRAAQERVANAPATLALAEVEKRWETWQRGELKFKSAAGFARKMVTEFPALRSVEYIERCCTRWKKAAWAAREKVLPGTD